MEPNRFDDVETRIVEEPEQVEPRAPRPGRRRIGPAVLAATAAISLMGSLAAGASALTSTAQAPTRTVEKRSEGQWMGKRHHGLCDKGERRSAASVKY